MTIEMLQIGDQFDRFQIQGHIAHGGMSDIYRAYDVVNRREVALKVPDLTMIGDPAQYERFQREKEILQTMDHPAVLRGLGCGQYNRVPYMAMELIDGQSLREYLTQHAPLPPEEALPLFLKIADGMAYVHEQGVVHRDLKPENILLDREGRPVIMDFGLALTRSAHRVTYANLSATMGTPEYMSPEQVEGKRGDERTDVYALGVILYEMLAGREPFSGDSPLAVMAQHVQSPAPRLQRDCPGIDPGLAAVVAKALQRDPAMRFQTVREMIQALTDPASAGLNLEDEAFTDSGQTPWYRSIYFRGVAIALLLMVAMVALALALQTLKH